MHLTFTYEHDWGFGWIAAEPPAMERASHALAHEGGVWLVDPVDGDGLHERIAALGEVRGVLQLLDRHPRDARGPRRPLRGAPHRDPVRRRCRAPRSRPSGSPTAGAGGRWRSGGPSRAVLVVTEALGTTAFFAAPGERVGVHALLRLTPPHRLTGIPARHLLVGHGPPLEGDDVPEQIARAVTRSRRDMPKLLIGMARAVRASRSSST